MKKKHFIYRYHQDGICVVPSRRESESEVWDFAIQWLRPAVVGDDKEAERIIREIGEVIPDDE